MKTALVVGPIALAVALNAAASWRILRSEAHALAQKTAWLSLVWLAPVLGTILALEVSSGEDHSGASSWIV